MSSTTKRVCGYLLDQESKETITEVIVELTFTENVNPAMQGGMKGVIILKGFLPQYNDKYVILKLNENIMGRVNLKLLNSISSIETRYKINFGADSFWTSDTKWFESL